jgi:hypothetical protein
MPPARRRPGFLSAAIAVLAAVLTVVLPATMASAASALAAGTRVGAAHPAVILTVGASRPVSPVQGRCESIPRPGFASGACVAAEDTGDLADAATCGGMSFTAGTKVLLASGAAIPISQLKTGDKVLATNTKTGMARDGTARPDSYRLTWACSASMRSASWPRDQLFSVRSALIRSGSDTRVPPGSSWRSHSAPIQPPVHASVVLKCSPTMSLAASLFVQQEALERILVLAAGGVARIPEAEIEWLKDQALRRRRQCHEGLLDGR